MTNIGVPASTTSRSSSRIVPGEGAPRVRVVAAGDPAPPVPYLHVVRRGRAGDLGEFDVGVLDVWRSMSKACSSVTSCSSISMRHGARLRAHARSRATVAVVSGQIDAGNAHWVREMLRRWVAVGTALVLDMSGVDFLGIQGLQDWSRCG
ncbi:MAG: Sulfate transporter [Mycobacterium sp.]|nr:Sulfate transporter [Mycobacterium sp.]